MMTFDPWRWLEFGKRYSPCRRKKTTAIIKAGHTIYAYNTLPKGYDESFCDNCPREGQKPGDWSGKQECPVIHAEVNAILAAARAGVQTVGGIMYCSYKPCLNCAKMIVEAGIMKVIYQDEYEGTEAEEYLKMCGVAVEKGEVE